MLRHLSVADRLEGLLLGCAVGDALGLPAEGLPPRRIKRWWSGPWRHRFLFGRGMISDDTEHAIFVAQSLLACPCDPETFQRTLAGKLRLWLLGFPAGIGLATLRSILRLWVGVSPSRSGVLSAGNGAAMRSAIIGAYFAEQADLRMAYVRASSRLTHTDPRAETAAQAIAAASAWTVVHAGNTEGFTRWLTDQGGDAEWKALLTQMNQSLARGDETRVFAEMLGLKQGVTGYAYHSVPIALYAWLRHPNDFRAAMESALNCGGDTDTVGAMVGALAGASMGADEMPEEWLDGLVDWPRSRQLLAEIATRLARQLQTGGPQEPVSYFWPGLFPRNLLFLLVVLAHGFRRLLPPY